jgi:hypothetical protein
MLSIDVDTFVEMLDKIAEKAGFADSTLITVRDIKALVADMSVEEQKSEEREAAWISVFDELPKQNQTVVVSDGERTWDVGRFQGLSGVTNDNDSDRPNIWNWRKCTTRKVLWWMPKENALPNPPVSKADA